MDASVKRAFLNVAAEGAEEAGHPWPKYAACEAALESSYGQSSLARNDNNIFGCKQHSHPLYGTVYLPTREFLSGTWITVEAEFVRYPSYAASFKDRIDTLRRLAPLYPHYKAALEAKTGEEFVTEVSQTWSTDPARAKKVLAIHRELYGDAA
jgi:flagellum-specific peptidoglycan hydrolase FlgJ